MKRKTQMFIILAIILISASGYYLGKSVSSNEFATYEIKGESLVIEKSSITSTASFIPYKIADYYMEIIAIKAEDGTIRTALNTCQVCYDSGRGHYDQVGDKLICNNCRNVFSISDIEVVRGGCNPIPITNIDKEDDGQSITISGDFLKENNFYFARWIK